MKKFYSCNSRNRFNNMNFKWNSWKAYIIVKSQFNPYLKNGTIFLASFSAILKPWEYSITSAMSCLSGLVIAKLLNNFFRLSGRLDRPAYPGFMVMNTAMSGFTLTCFPISSTDMEPINQKSKQWTSLFNTYLLTGFFSESYFWGNCVVSSLTAKFWVAKHLVFFVIIVINSKITEPVLESKPKLWYMYLQTV